MTGVPEVSAAGEAALNAVTLPRPSARPRTRLRPSRVPPAAAPQPAVAPRSRPAAEAALRGLTVEKALYGLFLILAVFSRFWNLGAKALHHDESLHAYFSWLYETGGGYRHDPLMHGPFLFHVEALVFFLFGASDASSRYAPAFFGVIMVGLPYLLRGPRHLGRWGALAASFLFLISPAILYQSRYIRHDIFTIVATLLFFTCIVRYLEVPERRWLIVGGIAAGILLTNHEIAFALLAIFALYLYGALVWGRFRAWRQDRPDDARRLLAVHFGFIVGALALYLLVPRHDKSDLLNIPWENPTKQQQLDYYKRVIENPFIIGMLLLLAGFVVALWYVLSEARSPERRDGGWLPSLLGDPAPGSVEFGIRRVWEDQRGLAIGLFITALIFVALFTSLFTNLDGLVTSTVATNGTLLYWLGQHDVRRGEQPWFYFLLLTPQYEFIAVTLGTALAALTCWRTLGVLLGRWSGGRNLFFRLFITVWLAGIFVGLSLAGEKMPWLVVHISLPATLLAAALIGGLIERAVAAVRVRRADPSRSLLFWPEWGLLAALLLAGACWLALAGRLTVGQFVATNEQSRGYWRRTLTSYDARHWWLLAIPPAVAIVLIAAGYAWRGPRRTGLAALAAVTIGLALLQVHTAWRMNYYEADVPRDMLIYTQTSPDVTRLMAELDQLSAETTGGRGMKIWYDSGVSWPMQWYLRDYPNKEYKGTAASSIPADVPVVVVSNDYERGFIQALSSNYTAQEYVLRWWFPEETYRDFAIAPELSPGRSALKSQNDPHGFLAVMKSVGHTLKGELNPDSQLRLYRLLMYRDLDWPNGQYNFKVYIRNDLLPFFNTIRYG